MVRFESAASHHQPGTILIAFGMNTSASNPCASAMELHGFGV